MRKNFLALFTAVIFILTISQVAVAVEYISGQTAEAYSLVHGGYVGQATIKVLPNGSLDVEIDEAFLPHTLTAVDLKSSEWSKANTANYVLRGKTVYVAKYVEYDGTVYVGTTVGESLTYVKANDSGEAVGGKDLEFMILKNQATMAAYFKNLRNGRLKILTGFKGMATPITTTKYGSVFKKASLEYWNFKQTWKGNITAIEKFIEENGAAYSYSEMKHPKDKDKDGLKFWSVADAVTGATNVDFKDYFGMVQQAIAQLKIK